LFDNTSEKLRILQKEIEVLEKNEPSGMYLSRKDRQLFDWHCANLEFANATPLESLSLRQWDQDDAYEFTGAHLAVHNGYALVPRAYADTLDVRLNKAVKKIVYNDKYCMLTVQDTKNESHEEEIVRCDAVLCTIPLGVLKEPVGSKSHIEFNPPLPQWKRAAIDRLGFGNLNKVILCFDHPFWDTDRHLFGHVAGTTTSRGELFLFWTMYKQPVVIALVAGKAANAMEDVSDDVIVARTMSVLKGIFGDDIVDKPKYSTVTKWKSDPWSKGSYSYVKVKSTGADYDVLSLPVDSHGSTAKEVLMQKKGKPKIFFAGEHTMRNYPATVHGALLSGSRESARIADFYLGKLDQADLHGL